MLTILLRCVHIFYDLQYIALNSPGGIRDHYAIMADVADKEIDYWRRNYGIHLVTYTTIARPDKSKDHAALLGLLDTLRKEAEPATTARDDLDSRNPAVLLALARYAAGLARAPKATSEFQIRVNAEGNMALTFGHYYHPDEFEHCPVQIFLEKGPKQVILVGLPGAGKTYALRQAAARSAERLQEACLSEKFDEAIAVLPIFVDLKLYRGDLGKLVAGALPASLALGSVKQRFKLKIFFDSFNEMPREYWESGSYEADFESFVKQIGNASFVIGSRTSDGLEKLALRVYSLDEIDSDAVETELQRSGMAISGRFEREVRQLLKRPFYFKLVTDQKIGFPKEPHPRDIYHSLLENVRKAFATRFAHQFDIEKALSLSAFEALNRGEEAFPLTELLRFLKAGLETEKLTNVEALDVANWLVSTALLIPYAGGRIGFVHQSITEYLAATELVRRYQADPNVLNEMLTLKRWDQALFLSVSLMPPKHGKAFLEKIFEADFALALNAAKYLDFGRDEIVSRFLREILARRETLGREHEICWAIQSQLPVTEAHERHLRALIDCGGSLGAAAVTRLVHLKGSRVKHELSANLVKYSDDHNLCNWTGKALQPFATSEDASLIASWADSLQDKIKQNSDGANGFVSGAANFLHGMDLSVIRMTILPRFRGFELKLSAK